MMDSGCRRVVVDTRTHARSTRHVCTSDDDFTHGVAHGGARDDEDDDDDDDDAAGAAAIGAPVSADFAHARGVRGGVHERAHGGFPVVGVPCVFSG